MVQDFFSFVFKLSVNECCLEKMMEDVSKATEALYRAISRLEGWKCLEENHCLHDLRLTAGTIPERGLG